MEVGFQTAGAPKRLTLSTCTVDVETTLNNVVVTVVGELDMGDADRVGDLLSEAAVSGKPIVRVDLSGLTFADSSAIKALLLGAKAAGGPLFLEIRSPCTEYQGKDSGEDCDNRDDNEEFNERKCLLRMFHMCRMARRPCLGTGQPANDVVAISEEVRSMT